MQSTNQPNIVFDFGGVLMQHDREGCLAALRQLMSDEYITNGLGFGNDSHDTLRYQFETGDCSAQEFLDQVLAHSKPGATAQQVTDAWNRMHAGIADSTWNQLESLRGKGYRLYLMSNTDDIHWQHTMALYGEKIDDLFDAVFLSFEEGTAKPDEAFFKVVDRRLAASTMQTLFVDDVAVNRKAAHQYVGWKAFETIDALFAQ
jgi:putative hydrolase of the HAD superfamily